MSTSTTILSRVSPKPHAPLMGSGLNLDANLPCGDADRVGSPRFCLYFLVCAATEGPLAGLVKMGITDGFAERHQEHTRVWGTFDLRRSALLRACSREEVLALETHLRRLYGDCGAGRRTWTRGRVPTSEELIALGSWRRHPGSCAKGYTEFYALECLEAMLREVEHWLATRGQRSAGARWRRGISPAECSMRVRLADPRATREQARALRENRQAATQRVAEQMRAASNHLMAQVLAFALAHQEQLVGVDLRAWRQARATRDARQGKYGLVGLYFRPAERTSGQDDASLESWRAAQAKLREDFVPMVALMKSIKANSPGRRAIISNPLEGVYTLVPGCSYDTGCLPRPLRAETLCVCAGNRHADSFHPSFAALEGLARMVACRQVWRQADLRW